MGDVSAEPSMEDILSSIKRIIAEEGDAGTPRHRRSAGARSLATSAPSSVTRPRSGTTSRFTVLSKVDLPDPDAPTSATNAPASIASDTSSTAAASA